MKTTIRARLHEKAIQVMTSMFNASIEDILIELVQNGRRAGASRLRITVKRNRTSYTVSVSDDGEGFADPQDMLSYGKSGWREAVVRSENAAGMGLLSLAQRGCTVRSRTKTVQWEVDLDPEHFAGHSDATIYAAPEASEPRDEQRWTTTISFETRPDETLSEICDAARNATRYGTLRATLIIDNQNGRSREKTLKNVPFLDATQYIERWEGLELGTRTGSPSTMKDSRPSEVNIHGVVVKHPLTDVRTLDGAWRVDVNVIDCPRLEMVLPARKRLIETPFLKALEERARLVAFKAMAAHPDPRPTYETWRQAKIAGIEIEPPPARLDRWIPETRCPYETTARGTTKTLCQIDGQPTVLRMEADLDPPLAQSLHRAIGANPRKIQTPLVRKNTKLEGYEWYETIPRLTAVHIEIANEDGTTRRFEQPLVTSEAVTTPRPETIRIGLTIEPPNAPPYTITLDTDLALTGGTDTDDPWESMDELMKSAEATITADSTLRPKELAELIRKAFFIRSMDPEAGTWERQSVEFDDRAFHMATRLLEGDDEATRKTIERVLKRTLSPTTTPGQTIGITVHDRKIDVELKHSKPMMAA